MIRIARYLCAIYIKHLQHIERNNWSCTCPQARPMPFSPIPCGHDKFNSKASDPAAYNKGNFTLHGGQTNCVVYKVFTIGYTKSSNKRITQIPQPFSLVRPSLHLNNHTLYYRWGSKIYIKFKLVIKILHCPRQPCKYIHRVSYSGHDPTFWYSRLQLCNTFSEGDFHGTQLTTAFVCRKMRLFAFLKKTLVQLDREKLPNMCNNNPSLVPSSVVI